MTLVSIFCFLSSVSTNVTTFFPSSQIARQHLVARGPTELICSVPGSPLGDGAVEDVASVGKSSASSATPVHGLSVIIKYHVAPSGYSNPWG